MTEYQRDVEKMALRNITLLHTTPKNNIKDKPNVLFRFKKQPQSPTLYCHLPKNVDGDGSKFWIVIEESGSWKLRWMASVINIHTGEVHVRNNKRYSAKGRNRMDALKTMMGIHTIWNEHSQRHLNLLELCNPHFVIPNRHNEQPKNPVELTTVIPVLFQWLNGEIR